MADYDFRTLSPNDFEILIRDFLAAEYHCAWRHSGVAATAAFGRGRDGGIDLRAKAPEGKVIVQCKHYLGSSFKDLRSSARREVPKMDKEKPDRSLFVTSQNLSRTRKDTLAEDLDPWLSDTADLLPQVDINDLIARNDLGVGGDGVGRRAAPVLIRRGRGCAVGRCRASRDGLRRL